MKQSIQSIHPLSRLLLAVALIGVPTAAVLTAPPTVQAASGVEGSWYTPNHEGTVEIAVSNGTLTGKLVASDNPDAPLGTEILRGFSKRGDVWVGTIYSPKRGRTADAELQLRGDKIVITVQAGVRTKTITWTRA